MFLWRRMLLQVLNFPLNGGTEVVVMPWSKSKVMKPVSGFLGSLSVYVEVVHALPGPCVASVSRDSRRRVARLQGGFSLV